MPEAKYAYKPTPAQMSVGDIIVHLSQGNDYLCGSIGGVKAPTRDKVATVEVEKAARPIRRKLSDERVREHLAGHRHAFLGASLLDAKEARRMALLAKAEWTAETVGTIADHDAARLPGAARRVLDEGHVVDDRNKRQRPRRGGEAYGDSAPTPGCAEERGENRHGGVAG